MKKIILIILLRFIVAQCDGFNWHHDININDCSKKDIKVLDDFIINSNGSLNFDMDINLNNTIEPLELGWQLWEKGRLIHWICDDVPSPFYFYNYNCNLSGEIPDNINLLDAIIKLHINYNKLNGVIPKTICDLDISRESRYWFNINGNYFCQPYPGCIELSNIDQNQSKCD